MSTTRKFTNQRLYNDFVDNAICGPLTTGEIRALIAAGERFREQKTLETEWTLSLLRGLKRAPDPSPFSHAYYAGRAAALGEALALVDIQSERGPAAAWEAWDEMLGYANAVENELLDRYNSEACAGAGDHAIPC
ncbi:MAG: hypothetical protein ACYCXX_13580 [Acidiferrobacter thiooxydans]